MYGGAIINARSVICVTILLFFVVVAITNLSEAARCRRIWWTCCKNWLCLSTKNLTSDSGHMPSSLSSGKLKHKCVLTIIRKDWQENITNLFVHY